MHPWRNSTRREGIRNRRLQKLKAALVFQSSLKAAHKLSLADAFAVALAKEKKAQLVTDNPEFKAVEKGIRIQWLG